MTKDIQPTTDEQDVGWCSGQHCPSYIEQRCWCSAIGDVAVCDVDICEPWARLIAAERKEIAEAVHYSEADGMSLVDVVRWMANS